MPDYWHLHNPVPLTVLNFFPKGYLCRGEGCPYIPKLRIRPLSSPCDCIAVPILRNPTLPIRPTICIGIHRRMTAQILHYLPDIQKILTYPLSHSFHSYNVNSLQWQRLDSVDIVLFSTTSIVPLPDPFVVLLFVCTSLSRIEMYISPFTSLIGEHS
jgi:hypothetical protein